MNPAYESFRDTVEWRRSTGDSEIPGLPSLGEPETIPVRIHEKLTELGGDTVSTVDICTLPEHTVQPQDRLGDTTVLAVEAVKDRAGNVLWWVAHARA